MLSIIIGSLLISLLHAVIPNHWLPVLAIGKKEGWSLAETSRITFIAGMAHVISTIIIGLLLAGGILLLWVSWKLWREICAQKQQAEAEAILEGNTASTQPPKTFKAAILQIVVADISMSLDNVLAVAGAAREHVWVLIFGLALSVVLMGVASTLMARLLIKYRWIAYVGLFVILYIALRMMWDGSLEVMTAVVGI